MVNSYFIKVAYFSYRGETAFAASRIFLFLLSLSCLSWLRFSCSLILFSIIKYAVFLICLNLLATSLLLIVNYLSYFSQAQTDNSILLNKSNNNFIKNSNSKLFYVTKKNNIVN